MGRVKSDRKQYEEAIKCFEKSIDIYRLLCGDFHINLAITLRNCGDCNKKLGRLKEANRDYINALEVYTNLKVEKD